MVAYGGSSTSPVGNLQVLLRNAGGGEEVTSRQFVVGVTPQRYKLVMPKSCDYGLASGATNAVSFVNLSAIASDNIMITYVINYSIKGLQ